MKRKAQIIGQVFIFVIAVFVFSAIIIYGYSYINKIITQQQKIALIEFKKTLEEEIDKIQYLHGSVRKLELKIPSGYSKVCFADSVNAINNRKFPMLAELARFGQTVFLIPLQELSIKIKNLRVNIEENTICCLPAEKVLVLSLESKKEGVYVSPWDDYLKCE